MTTRRELRAVVVSDAGRWCVVIWDTTGRIVESIPVPKGGYPDTAVVQRVLRAHQWRPVEIRNHGAIAVTRMSPADEVPAIAPVSARTHHNAMKKACPQGHEYTAENIVWQGNKRLCKACKRIREKERRRMRSRETGA